MKISPFSFKEWTVNCNKSSLKILPFNKELNFIVKLKLM